MHEVGGHFTKDLHLVIVWQLGLNRKRLLPDSSQFNKCCLSYLFFKIPSYVKKGNEVKVEIEKKRIKAMYKDDKGLWQTQIEGELCWDIRKEESMWSLVPGEHIHVSNIILGTNKFC